MLHTIALYVSPTRLYTPCGQGSPNSHKGEQRVRELIHLLLCEAGLVHLWMWVLSLLETLNSLNLYPSHCTLLVYIAL